MSRGAVVVMPTYNEAENVKRLIPKIVDLVRATGWRVLVLVVDDNSPDGTAEVAEGMGAQGYPVEVLRRPGKLGIGSAYVDGFRKALERHDWADYVCEMDADGSHPPETLLEMLEYAEKTGADVVVGSRYIEGGRWDRGSKIRILISRGANILAKISAGIKVRDATSGLRVIRAASLRKILDKLPQLRSGYVFQVQLLHMFQEAGCRIDEYPLRFLPRITGESKLGKGEILAYASWCLRMLARRLLRR